MVYVKAKILDLLEYQSEHTLMVSELGIMNTMLSDHDFYGKYSQSYILNRIKTLTEDLQDLENKYFGEIQTIPEGKEFKSN